MFLQIGPILATSFLALTLLAMPSAGHAASPSDCPVSKEGWITWRNAAVADMLTPSPTCSDFGGHPVNLCTRKPHGNEQYLCRAKVAKKGDAILEKIAHCNPQQEIRDELLTNLMRFTTEVGRQFKKNHSHGYMITDRQYVDYARHATAFPELLASQEFLQKISDPKRYSQAMDMIEKRNESAPANDQWSTLLYDAPFLPSPDCKTYGQFMIHIPGVIDKWIQFGILPPDRIGETTELNGVSVVAVRPTKNPKFKNEVLIMDYWRTYEDDKIEVDPKILATGGTTNCYACHKSPVMPFYPTKGFTFDHNGNLVDQDAATTKQLREYLNQQQAAYGPPYFGGLLDPSGFGPGIGPADRPRTDDFLATCTAAWPGVDKIKIAELMKCGTCHDGHLMGRINFPQAVPSDRDAHSTGGLGKMPWATLTFVETFIQLGYMPPQGQNPPLTVDEKSALSHCLLTEYYDPKAQTGLLFDWLHNEIE